MQMRKMNKLMRRMFVLAVASAVLALLSGMALAQEAPADPPVTGETSEALAVQAEPVAAAVVDPIAAGIDTTWLLLSAMLVFFMQAGFALLEAGLIRQTGAVNALTENFMDAGLTAICFWLVGYGIAFGSSVGGFFGGDKFLLSGLVSFGAEGVEYAYFLPTITEISFFFFQFAFAATASTIATGAMAERTHFVGDIIYSALVALLIYPVVVHWVWGGGWLGTTIGFHDFAGSTVVHTVGGVLALVGAIALGPRAGRVWGSPPKPHNLALATLGTLILWFGWYGFNTGSTLGAVGYDGLMGLVATNTTLAAAAGALATMVFMFARSGKWDLSATLNGSLAGLVGITAPCAFVAPWAAVLIGLTAGIVVVLAADAVEAAKVDDPVGAFAVHGACGIMGTLAVGLFAQPQLTFAGSLAGAGGLFITGETGVLVAQLIGSGAVVLWTVATGTVMFGALKLVGLLRVSAAADAIGIDAYEHGVSLWPDVLPADSEKSAAGVAAGD